MSDVDSDGYPVSPWHSRFVEVSEGSPPDFVEAMGPEVVDFVPLRGGEWRPGVFTFDEAQEDSVREFVDAVARGFDRMVEVMKPFVDAYRLSIEQISKLAEILSRPLWPTETEIRTRRAVALQRRRRR